MCSYNTPSSDGGVFSQCPPPHFRMTTPDHCFIPHSWNLSGHTELHIGWTAGNVSISSGSWIWRKRRLILKSSVLPWKRGFIWADKSVFYHKKRGSLSTESECFIAKMGSFWAEKSVFCHKKGVIFKLENKDGYHFFQWVREPGHVPCLIIFLGSRRFCINTTNIIHSQKI